MAQSGDNLGQTLRNGPVNLEGWLAANQPRLHPTRRKVLQVAVALGSEEQWVLSSEIREATGLSQQLLNRHLRGLQAQGLVQIAPTGPGLPLSVRPTAAGLRVLGLRGPGRLAAHAPELQQADAPAENRGVLGNAGLSLYQTLSPYLKGLGQDDFARLVQKCAAEMNKSQAVSPVPAPAPQPAPAHGSPAATAEEPDELLPQEPEKTLAWGVSPDASQAPVLSPAEAALEQKLAQTAHADYHGIPWHRRTRMLSAEWDQTRRRRLGLLNTYFIDFGPRWDRPDWADFQTARRQADSRGARYEDWIAAQFSRLAPQGIKDVLPKDLHGEDALNAYLRTLPAMDAQPPRRLGPPPYTLDTFNLNNPDHASYAEQVLAEIGELAQRVFGNDPDGPLRLVEQAFKNGTLPVAALDLRPQWKERILAEKRLNGHNGIRSNSHPNPSVII